jgi:hypothetical protein
VAGEFDLVVTARNGWSMTNSSGTDCELLRRKITVVERSNNQLIVAGVIAAIIMLTLGALLYYANKKKASLKQVLTSFAVYEGVIVFDICLEVWVPPPARPRAFPLFAELGL